MLTNVDTSDEILWKFSSQNGLELHIARKPASNGRKRVTPLAAILLKDCGYLTTLQFANAVHIFFEMRSSPNSGDSRNFVNNAEERRMSVGSGRGNDC